MDVIGHTIDIQNGLRGRLPNKATFKSRNHEIIARRRNRLVKDKKLVSLLDNIISSFVTVADKKVGLPLGNLTSQLFANVYMNPLDQWVKHELKCKYYIRYADDFIFLSPNKAELTKLIPSISKFLREQLRLDLHPNKVYIRTVASGVDFLGWVHFPDHRVLRSTTKRRAFRGIKEKNAKIETVQSYLGVLSHGNTKKLRQKVLTLVSKIEN